MEMGRTYGKNEGQQTDRTLQSIKTHSRWRGGMGGGGGGGGGSAAAREELTYDR